jgi:hypothetical protein
MDHERLQYLRAYSEELRERVLDTHIKVDATRRETEDLHRRIGLVRLGQDGSTLTRPR